MVSPHALKNFKEAKDLAPDFRKILDSRIYARKNFKDVTYVASGSWKIQDTRTSYMGNKWNKEHTVSL